MQTAPAIDLSAIPAAQRAAVLTLMETVAALTEITRRQDHLIAELNHALHGKRSEKLSEDERQLAFEDLSIALAEVETEKETRAAKTGDMAATKPAPVEEETPAPAPKKSAKLAAVVDDAEAAPKATVKVEAEAEEEAPAPAPKKVAKVVEVDDDITAGLDDMLNDLGFDDEE